MVILMRSAKVTLFIRSDLIMYQLVINRLLNMPLLPCCMHVFNEIINTKLMISDQS